MPSINKPILLLLSFLLPLCAMAQQDGKAVPQHGAEPTLFPKDYFDVPLRRPMEFSGSFAELRANHFHSGVDMRIGAKIGEPVYAPADGYVSRINISPWGGGKVLYITHPNGYRTVYMHLDDFVGDIGAWVRNYQYSHRVYGFDAAVPKDTLRVEKGQLIAHAGNSGSSGGPHLHYEIRYADNDQPINPLYFGIPYEDDIPPVIRGIRLYAAEEGATVAGKESSVALPLAKQNDTVTVSGKFYLGIYATDISKGSPGKNGVESIHLYVDDSLYFSYSVPSFLFEETRAMNAIIDYPLYRSTRQYYILTRRLRGNRNNFCRASDDRGILSFAEGSCHRLRYEVRDYKGNLATHRFVVRALAAPKEQEPAEPLAGIDHRGIPVSYFKRNLIEQNGFKALLEESTLYDNDLMLYSVAPYKGLLSPLHTLTLQQHDLPPHKSFTVRLLIPALQDTTLIDKLVIVSINGDRLNALATKRKGDYLEAHPRVFGGFGISIDTVPPTIRAVNFKSGQRCPAVLKVKVRDNLSGINEYHCYINGTWVLSEHDGKTATLHISTRNTLPPGKNEVRLQVTDVAGNQTETTFTLVQ